jgi:hypothetical protein
MFELFMLLGFGLAAFSQLLPVERRTAAHRCNKHTSVTASARQVRVDAPGRGASEMRRCSLLKDSQRLPVHLRMSRLP